jgi:hypothetical protein
MMAMASFLRCNGFAVPNIDFDTSASADEDLNLVSEISLQLRYSIVAELRNYNIRSHRPL